MLDMTDRLLTFFVAFLHWWHFNPWYECLNQPTIRVRYREDQTMNKENHTSTQPNLRIRHMIAARNQTGIITGTRCEVRYDIFPSMDGSDKEATPPAHSYHLSQSSYTMVAFIVGSKAL